MTTQGTSTAIACFVEAKDQTPRDTNPVQWNIANGLAHIAIAMQEMQAEIRTLRAEVHALSQK
jgi:hypothetical protein